MHEFFHALDVFFGQVASVGWAALAIALGLHFLKLVLRTIAWRNRSCAAAPDPTTEARAMARW